jgi:hypothetical protein
MEPSRSKTSMNPPPSQPSPSLPLYRARVIKETGTSQSGFYAVEVHAGNAGPAGWLVVDDTGRVVAHAHSELLAIAKMQMLRLSQLAALPGRQPQAAALP